ncbi:hypothetical protein SCLARK_001524 [Spiroplasma clarkii]|uniref:Uncharacterized protein n=1 Tax=Spiroplasma clarkii TaxID=2139 RepID=A0A1Y0L2T3_9MOLU|nr:hypothetical protein [Spiroplasma clarkii]ARU92035.1 hypothetical protein SCLARK_001524 [Spiroplasma clarkii]ATX71366.1 hypothetical protein SCLAR_v1c10660 [Spiroplasma clarkii]
MLNIIIFNYQRLIQRWYFIIAFIGYATFWIMPWFGGFDFITTVKTSSSFVQNFIMSSNLIIILMTSFYLYFDYKSGLWKLLFTSKASKLKIILGYFLSALILSQCILLIILLLVSAIYAKTISDYGIWFNIIFDFWVLPTLTTLVFILIACCIFCYFPKDMSLEVFILGLISIIISALRMTVWTLTLEKWMVWSLMVLPLLNLFLLESHYNYFWVPVIVNTCFGLLVLLVIFLKTKEVKKNETFNVKVNIK